LRAPAATVVLHRRRCGTFLARSGKWVVYVGSLVDNVYALNAKTGAKVWSYRTGSSVNSSPAVANGVVYVGSDDGKVYAFSQK